MIKVTKRFIFILPNLFTLAGIFCGFYAILLLLSPTRLDAFHQAGMAIFFACFFDMFDGRIARLTRTQSAFGMELDSLCDAVSFGVAPAILVYQWALRHLGPAGIFMTFAFAACGVIRLARFNVLTKKGMDSGEFFVGLPIPMAAISLVSFIFSYEAFLADYVSSQLISASIVTLVLAYLMVSPVHYWSFKKSHMGSSQAILFMGFLVFFVMASLFLPPSLVIFAVLSVYIFLGVFRALHRIFLGSRTV